MKFDNTQANPFNWVGSKFRYLADFMEVLPKEDNMKVLDCFLGGGDLISKLPKDWEVTAIDIMPQLVEMHVAIQEGKLTPDAIMREFIKRQLSKDNEQGYLQLREEYNTLNTPQGLYLLMTNSFNNQLRFNRNGGFNMPFGKNRSSFNPRMQAKLSNYIKALGERRVFFKCGSYTEEVFNEYDLLLVDPPYLNTTATYNEQGGWGAREDEDLLLRLDNYSGKFVYFNQLISKGVENTKLLEWASKYNTKILKDTTKTCNHQRKGGTTVEVMITNY